MFRTRRWIRSERKRGNAGNVGSGVRNKRCWPLCPLFSGMGQAERDDKGNTEDRAERLGGVSVVSVASWMNGPYVNGSNRSLGT